MFVIRLFLFRLLHHWILFSIVLAQSDDDFSEESNESRRGGNVRQPQQQDYSSLQLNDACVVTNSRWPGICSLSSQCPEVILAYQQTNQKPTVCAYGSKELIVCCPQRPAATQTPSFGGWSQPRPQPAAPNANTVWGVAAPRTTTSSSNVIFDNNINRKSQQKCEEYSKLAIHTATFTLLSVMTTVDKVSIPTCTYPTGLIVGGVVTKAGEFPHMAVIGWTETDAVKWNCGGSLISEYFVLTAGHCAAVRGVRPDIVRLGEQNLVRSDDKANPRDYGVADIIVHPSYKQSSHYNDIALIRLNARVTFTKGIRPACLWQNYELNSTKGVATGWGQVEYAGERSNDLQKVGLDFVSNSKCSQMYEPSKRIRQGIVDSQVCAGVLAGGKDTCQGDSGGPIQVLTPKNQCIFHIVGVTSFGRACASQNSVGVYTRVYSFLDWLEPIVWP